MSRPKKLQLTKTVEGGQVRQKVQGRSKTVTVEVRRTRTYTKDKEGGRMVEVDRAKEAAEASDGLSREEREARLKALQSAEEDKSSDTAAAPRPAEVQVVSQPNKDVVHAPKKHATGTVCSSRSRRNRKLLLPKQSAWKKNPSG